MHKKKIWISTGKNRFETSWKNQEISWIALVNRLQKPVVTDETLAEYLKMSKDRQGEIKDVGGFVGGTINGGKRRINSVTGRFLLTLDVDYATHEFWDSLSILYDYEMILYSTHKHSPDAARYRLVIPLSRECMPDEYEAAARKFAEHVGINLFDPTTFQPERLMYWPSVSKDCELEFYHQEGQWLDVDGLLAEYQDWQDTSQWAYSDQAKKRIKLGIEKQEDPLTKSGMVGVFCRTYGMELAISKFLGDIYEPTGHDDRWTYKLGSTSGGLITYDDKWAFSHHSTDPVCSRLCNSFDLVRIHLFGDVDDRAEPDTPLNKKPSYNKMLELITLDENVKATLIKEKQESGQKRTDRIIEEGKDWTSLLEVDKRGITSTINNMVIILEHDPAIKDCLSFDDLQKLPIVKRDLPWRKVDRYGQIMKESDEAEFRAYFEIMYGLTAREKIKDAIEIVTHKNIFHPIRDYLKTLEWDRKKRVETMLIDLAGAEDSVYVREVTRKSFVAAVARIFEPGIKFDHMMVLVGPQGIGKSRLIAQLGMEWFSDTFGNLQNKDAMEQVQGVWIMEVGELAGLKKQEVDTIKLFLSKCEDRFRVAYGRRVDKYPRQCIFIGTTNNDVFLQDQTGNRRFWPIALGRQKIKQIDQEFVNQFWAECCYLYTMGETLYLDESVEIFAKEVQDQYTEIDDRSKLIYEYINRKVPARWYEFNMYEKQSWLQGDDTLGEPEKERDYITVPEIWTELFRGQIKDMTPMNVKHIRNIMNKIEGWVPVLINRRATFGTQRGWARASSKSSTEKD